MPPKRDDWAETSDLHCVPVNEAACRRRTGKILKVVQGISEQVSEINSTVKAHRAWHSGRDMAGGQMVSVAKIVGIILTMAAIIGGAAWAIAVKGL